ncbi:hypothetical protein SAMN05216251_11972 [Actinacidiphila alni]|uniref:Integral membrane protein n=1 Tax=Actinacidiphila alni TaxID=380248 RepID=A0A1I2JVA9_9ACTN|nr:hypothetical protein [Actinacidiphila alni]SFF56731.1 hypothetical protein SAMN05216251_11972 [Actinacidiphila alni]
MPTQPGAGADTSEDTAVRTAPEAAGTAAPPVALELLVHGVGGTTPALMLDDPRTVCLAGDDTAGIHRRACDADAEEHPETHRDGPVPEAYCWSNLTSGNGSRALWLLLLPFMIANLAHWMRPPSTRRRLGVAYEVLVRLIALTLTVLLVAAACEVALDIVGWQCAGRSGCSRHQTWLGFAAAARGGWWSEPGRRLALAAVAPLALTGLLWWLSRRTWSAYESQRPTGGWTPSAPGTAHRAVAAPGTEAGAEPPALALPGFWYGRHSVARLRTAHTAAALATVSAALCVPALRHDHGRGGSVLAALGWALAGLLALLTAVAVVAAARARRTEDDLDDATDRRATRLLLIGSAVVLAAAVLYSGWHRPGWTSSGRLPAAQTFTTLTVLQGALIAALAVIAGLLHRTPTPLSGPGPTGRREAAEAAASTVAAGPTATSGPTVATDPAVPTGSTGRTSPTEATGSAKPAQAAGLTGPLEPTAAPPRGVALRGLAGPAVALLACALGGVLTGGVAQRCADWLDRGPTPGEDGSPLAGPPAVLMWEASVIPAVLVVLLLCGAAVMVRLRKRERALYAQVEGLYPDEPHHPFRTRQIAGAIARAGLTDSAPLLIAVVCAAAFALGAGAVVGAWTGSGTPGDTAAGAPDVLAACARTAQALGSWLVGAGVVALVALGRRAYRDASARRTVGILWDVGTFWPRAAHPFAPPCYAERAVPDLSWRMASWTQATGGRIILSGHSQGSVLSAAAVWQLDPETRGRVALLTYGCPLDRLYGRWFPAHFGPDRLRALHDDMHAWRNLWRRTDPIGGPVHLDPPHPAGSSGGTAKAAAPVDRGPLLDPVAYGRSLRHPLPAPVLGHSDFQADPAFAEERAALLAELVCSSGRTAPRAGTLPAQGGAQGSSGRSSG